MSDNAPDHIITDAGSAQSTRTIVAPVAGAVVAREAIGDPVFSSGAMGEGAGIHPTDGTVIAPIAGEVIAAMPHAYGISGGGVEVLVHIGIDTVEMGGTGFTSAVTTGQKVEPGDVLATVDFGAVRAAGFDTTVVVVVTNSAALGGVDATVAASVDAGEPLLTVGL
ncbi:PTS glucose transporter subunit IIA [Herbiconiux sp. L3-i23]|uniref:PTS sugar transporter subunit IIA n=1 Tax=Herbiconiux sp. L3-i23 TaxID=2905871 RepID=UPI00205631C1|nr:PTS glucose transporter subunit IIA [Herbiconiux sp. L3-i23]BDI22589.1 hypothetical protein L3i23_13650 [Herbiconiux sp. L3-i23]